MKDPVERKPIDRWLPWTFVAFFAVVVSVNAVMVYFAATSWTGIHTTKHYLKGLDYNRTLEAVERQKARGWTGTLSVASEKDAVRLDLSLLDVGKKALAGADVTARFVRPTHEGYDLEIKLVDFGEGQYTGRLQAPLPGQWDVHVVARHSQGDYRVTRRIVVP